MSWQAILVYVFFFKGISEWNWEKCFVLPVKVMTLENKYFFSLLYQFWVISKIHKK